MFGDKISIELRGLIIASCATVLVLGLALPFSRIVRSEGTKPVSNTQSLTNSTSGTSAGTVYTPSQLLRGDTIFKDTCVSCHGADASGGDGPSLHGLGLNDAQIDSTIANGRGEMPAFGKQFTAQDVTDIVAYLRTLR